MDFSFNAFLGPVSLATSLDEEQAKTLRQLSIGNNPFLTCPINLDHFTELKSLDLQAIGAHGCEWNEEVHLPRNITSLDISYVHWGHPDDSFVFSMSSHPLLEELYAVDSHLVGLDTLSRPDTSNLQTLKLDENRMMDPTRLLRFIRQADLTSLQTVSLVGCQLQLDVGSFYQLLASIAIHLTRLDLANNNLIGSIPASLQTYYKSVQSVSFANNPQLTGSLSDIGDVTQGR